jgi:hypothetical protein
MKAMKKSSLKFLSAEDFFVAIFGVVGLTLLIVWVISGSPTRTETSDKLTYVITGIAALVFGLFSLRRRLSSSVLGFVATSAWAMAGIGIFVVEHQEMSKEHPMGFGLGVFLLTLLITPFVYRYFEKKQIPSWINPIIWVLAGFVTISVVLAYFQTDKTLLESGHSEYVINEIWSPATGYESYQEFIPQYVFLIGWLLKPLLSALGAIEGTKVLVLILTAFGFVCLGGMLWLAKRSWQALPWPLLLLAAIPFSTPTPGWNRISFIGPASTLLSGPALRVLGGIIVGWATISTIDRIYREKTPSWLAIVPGIVSAVVVWNNLDFGLAAFVAALVLFISTSLIFEKSKRRGLVFFLFGHMLGHAIVLSYLRTQEGIPNWSYFGWFVRQFGGGFGGVTIEVPGPVLVSLPLMFSSAATGVYVLLRWNNLSEEIKTEQNWRSAITASFFGSFCVFALPYYVNRSYHAGQMSILYIPLAVAVIATISLLLSMRSLSGKLSMTRAFPAFIFSFMAATIFLIPNPTIEWDRIRGGNPNGTFPRPPLQKVIDQMPSALQYARDNGKTIGFFGEGGNYVHALNSFPSANIFNSPLDMFQSDAAIQLSCRILKDRSFDLLLLTESAEYTFAWDDGSLCQGLYKKVDIPGIGKLGVKNS